MFSNYLSKQEIDKLPMMSPDGLKDLFDCFKDVPPSYLNIINKDNELNFNTPNINDLENICNLKEKSTKSHININILKKTKKNNQYKIKTRFRKMNRSIGYYLRNN